MAAEEDRLKWVNVVLVGGPKDREVYAVQEDTHSLYFEELDPCRPSWTEFRGDPLELLKIQQHQYRRLYAYDACFMVHHSLGANEGLTRVLEFYTKGKL